MSDKKSFEEKVNYSIGPVGTKYIQPVEHKYSFSLIYLILGIGLFIALISIGSIFLENYNFSFERKADINQYVSVDSESFNLGSVLTNFASGFYAKITGFITEDIISPTDAPVVDETPSDTPAESSDIPADSVPGLPIEPPLPPTPIEENLTDISEITPEVNLTEPEIITSENISLAENITLIENITALNETGEVQTEPIQEINITNATAINETILNETLIVTNLTANITLQETTIQYGAVIGKPVKWQKKIKIESSSDQPSNEKINIELPNLAGKISVKKIDAETGQETEITDNADIKNEKIIEVESAGSGGITGNTISTENLDSNNNVFDFFKNIFANIFRFTGKIIDNMEGSAQENVSVSINESLSQNDEIVVEYYTDAPYAEEKLLSDSSKQVVIVGPDEVHYEDVLAYSELPEEVASANKIKLYWINNSTGKREIANFEAQDSDGNGLLDIIQWTVPSLSNQTYEIILITKALHLD